jgi:hypothetical protein
MPQQQQQYGGRPGPVGGGIGLGNNGRGMGVSEADGQDMAEIWEMGTLSKIRWQLPKELDPTHSSYQYEGIPSHS